MRARVGELEGQVAALMERVRDAEPADVREVLGEETQTSRVGERG